MNPLAALCLAVLALSQAAVGRGASDRPHWPHYEGENRTVHLLDGDAWQFGLILDPGFDSSSLGLDPASIETPNTTRVPSCFDAAPMGVEGPRGVGAYRTTFSHAAHRAARLEFEACSFFCRVFVDGMEVGQHKAGGYVAFHLDVPPPNATSTAPVAMRELLVLADNRFNATTAPLHTGGDFTMFGGLVRSVSVHEIPIRGSTLPPVVWRAEVLPNDVTVRSSTSADRTVNISIILSDDSYSGPFEYSLRFNAAAEIQGPFKATALNGRVETATFVDVPGTSSDEALWSLSQPTLHTVAVGDATGMGSIVVERFGLRTWGVNPETKQLTLNGHAVKLHGFNHHTQWPDVQGDNISATASMTEEQMAFDLDQMKSIGTNFVRGAHYPQDARWLDRLDEAGMAMWEETLGPGVSLNNIKDPKWMELQLVQLNEMIDHSINHASIMTWGWFNEGPSSNSEACAGYSANAQAAQSRDPTRFSTWASNAAKSDKCLEHATLVSFNSYPGWYGGVGNLSAPAAFWEDAASFVRSMDKPFVISETGAGGIYEWTQNGTSDAKWTQKYQTEVISNDVDVALRNANISGITIWHYFDFKTPVANCKPCDYIPGEFPPVCGFIDVKCFRPGGYNHST